MSKILISHPESDHPALPKENLFLAKDGSGAFLGSASLHPYTSPDLEPQHPHNIGILFHPTPEITLTDLVKEHLLESIYQRAAKIKSQAGADRTRLYACYFSQQRDEIEFFLQRGFQHDESMLVLERDLGQDWFKYPRPDPFQLSSSLLETESGRDQFIQAHRQIFLQHGYTPEGLAELSQEPGWRNFTALAGNEIAGNIMLFQDNQDSSLGYIEDLFVVQAWRKKGLAKWLVTTGLDYLESLGLSHVRLELWSANRAAQDLYRQFDFQVIEETQIALGIYI